MRGDDAVTAYAPATPVCRDACASVAGELLAQGGQRLVRGKSALGDRGARASLAGVLGRSRVGGVRRGIGLAGDGRLGVGLGGLLDLGAVCLPAGVRLGVLLLPDLALLRVALEPLVGLGVEALGV